MQIPSYLPLALNTVLSLLVHIVIGWVVDGVESEVGSCCLEGGRGVTSCLCDEVGALVLVFVMKMLVLQNKCYILEGVDGGHELSV